MKAALSTLTAATTRARRSAPAQACTAANVGTTNSPPAIASPARSIAMWRPPRESETGGDPQRARAVDERGRGPAEIDRKQAEQHGADQRRQDDDAPGGEPRGKAGTDRHRNREDGRGKR